MQSVHYRIAEFFNELIQFSAGQQRQLKPENKKEPEDYNKWTELVWGKGQQSSKKQKEDILNQ